MFYGWIVVGVSFLTITIGTSVRQSIIILFPALLEDFRWSRTVLSLVPSLSGFIVSVFSFYLGYLSDRIDIKRIIPFGALVASLGLFACFFLTRLWQLVLFYGVLTSIGVSALGMLPQTIIISNWFVKKRGTAIGIIASGRGAGTLIFMPLIQAVISRWGWQVSFVTLALLAGPLLIPVIVLLQKSNPAQMGLRADGTERTPQTREPDLRAHKAEKAAAEPLLPKLLRNRRFWFAFFQFTLGPLSTTPVIFHQAAYLQDKGLAKMSSAWVVGFYGLATFFGMLASGVLSDRIGREKSYSLGTVNILLGCALLLMIRSNASILLAILYSVFFGLGFGSRPSLDAATVADLFKGKRFGEIYGILSLGLGLGYLLGPVLAGMIFDRSGSYLAVLVVCMILVLVSTLCIWMSAPRRGKEEALT
jgi:sugar phosphate permease